MDTTNGVLSSLVQTKSLERVLSPISSKISQLIIQNEAYGQGDHTAFPEDLTPSAMDVMRSSEKLSDAGSSLISTSTDQILKSHMPQACESLSVAGQALVTAAQRLQIEQFSPEARSHLITCAKHVLEATLKVLLVSDDSEVRRIVKAGHCVLERMAVLTSVRHMKDLVPVFKSITDAVQIFCNMADRRQLDLTNRTQREAMINSVLGLRKSLPMLNSSMQTYVKFPDNAQALSGKEYAVGQIIESVNDVIAALENNHQSRSLDEVEEPGNFVTTIDRIVAWLADSEGDMKSYDGEFEQVVESAIRHSMAVAHLSQQQQRTHIINSCHLILKEQTLLFDLVKSMQVDQDLTQVMEEFIQLCKTFTANIQKLEEYVNDAVIHLVIYVCKESSEPFERLVKAAMSLFSTELQNNIDTEEALKPYIESFHTHSDTLCQVARFVAAACPQPKSVRSLCCCVNQLEKLDPELVPSTLACRTKNTAAMEHLRMIKQEWAANVDLLYTNIDVVIDKDKFIETAEMLLRENVNQCKNSIYSEMDDIVVVTRTVVGQGRRFMLVAQKVANQLEDISHRNTVMTYLNQLKKVLKATKSAASRLLGDTGELRYHETLHARCELVITWVSKVKAVLRGEGHPENLICDDEKFQRLEIDDGEIDRRNKGQIYGFDGGENEGLYEASSTKATCDSKQEQKALKMYIADLKNDRIQELSRSFVSCSIAGERQKADLLSNDLLKWTNHICDIAASLVTCTDNEDKKKTLSDLGSCIKCNVSDMLDTSKKVLDCYIEHIEQLHKNADLWTNHMSYLMTYIDGLIDKWKVVSDRVVDAAKLCNVQLVTGQMLNVNTHQKFVLEIATSSRSLLQTQVEIGQERGFVLQDNCLELENLTVLLATQADSLAKSDCSYEKEHIEMTSRELASRMYVIITTVVSIGCQKLSRSRNITEKHIENIKHAQKVIAGLTEDTIRVKTLVETASESQPASNPLQDKVDRLDSLLAAMTENYDLMCTAVSTAQEVEKFYAPYNLMLLQWTWVCQVSDIFGAIGVTVGEYTVLPQLLLSSTANKESLSALTKTYQERLNKLKSTVNVAIQPCSALDQKQAVWQLLKELESICTELSDLVKLDPETKITFRCQLLCKTWGVKSKKLLDLLNSMTSANKSSLRDAEKLLKGQPDQSIPSTSMIHRVTGRHSNTATPNSQRVTAQENSISTSLLDFADNLGTTLFQFGDEDLTDSPVVRNSSASKTPQSSAGTPYTYTPEVKPMSTPDPSWQLLAQGPKMNHSTPIRPTDKSGFRSKPNTTEKSGLRSKPNTSRVQGSTWIVDAERWEDEHNAIVRVARQTMYHVNNMAAYLKGEGSIDTRDELIDIAKTVAVNGEKLVKFAKILVDYSTDKRCASDLHSYCMNIPTVIAQLHIMSRVKEASPDDDNGAERMLLKAAQNLVSGISKMLNAAEAVSVKGLRQPPKEALDETEAIILATQWKRRFNQHRQVETSNANRDALGLRKINHINAAPALVNIMQQR